MEITVDTKFRPIIITLETKADVVGMLRMCNQYLYHGQYDHDMALKIKGFLVQHAKGIKED